MINYEEKFYVEKKINAPADRVWKIISKPEGLTQYHPFMKKHVVEGCSWEGVGAKDHLEYYSGLKWDREVMGWNEGVGFDLKVT